MQQTLRDLGHQGTDLVGFGDEFVALENVNQLSGIAIDRSRRDRDSSKTTSGTSQLPQAVAW